MRLGCPVRAAAFDCFCWLVASFDVTWEWDGHRGLDRNPIE